jgi:hypothetical protein
MCVESRSSVAEVWRRVLRDQWLVLARPSLASFQEATAPLGGRELLLAVGPACLLTGLLRLLGSPATGQGPLEAFLGGGFSNLVVYGMRAGVLLGGVFLAGGRSDVFLYLYALGLFWPVLNIVLGAPGLGALLWFGVAVYGLYLSYLAVWVVYGLTPTKARLIAFIPVMIGAFLALVFWVVLFLFAGSTVLTASP